LRDSNQKLAFLDRVGDAPIGSRGGKRQAKGVGIGGWAGLLLLRRSPSWQQPGMAG